MRSHAAFVVLLLLGASIASAQSRPTTSEFPPVESRGVWIPSSDLLGPRDVLLKKLDQLKAANFNTVMIDCWFDGYTAYPGSAVAPQHPDLDGDVFAVVLDEAQHRGFRVEAWLSHGFYAYLTTDATKDKSMGAILDKYPELAAVNAKGERRIHSKSGDYYAMCPSNPKSHQAIRNLIAEIAGRYPVDGIHLDRILYPDGDFCFCDYCKSHFEADTRTALQPFPPGSVEEKRWIKWKRQQMLTAVGWFRNQVPRRLRMTAHVVGPDEMDAHGQSWDQWADAGLVDAVAVSMYDADIQPAAKEALLRLGPAVGRMICAISADGIDPAVYAKNVQVARQYSTMGQFTWYLGQLDDKDFELLRTGPYAQPATDWLSQSHDRR